MTSIAIILGSTRPGRKGEVVARWIHDLAVQRADATFELIDLADHPLPLYDEPAPSAAGNYQHEHTKKWAELIGRFDGYIVVTPEYNHAPPAVLKNAFDYLFKEWNNKSIGFVGYGAVGAARAVEVLRMIAGELAMADVRAAVAISMIHDFESFTTFKPSPFQEQRATLMLNQVVAWADAMKTVRDTPAR